MVPILRPVHVLDRRTGLDRTVCRLWTTPYSYMSLVESYLLNLFIFLRSVVIHKTPVPHRWVCANIELDGVRQMLTAVARFTYPVAGQIIFKQDADDPFSDTAVLVDGLLYSDGTKVAHLIFYCPNSDTTEMLRVGCVTPQRWHYVQS